MPDMKTKAKELSVFTVFSRLAPVCFKNTPMVFELSVMMANSLLSGAAILLTQRLLDRAAEFAAGGAAMGSVLSALAFLVLAHAGNHISIGLINYVGNKNHLKIVGILRKEINKKAARLAPADFENTAILNYINTAGEGSFNAVSFVLTTTLIFAVFLPYFCFVAAYLFSLKPLLVLALGAAFIPAALIQFLRVKVFTRLEDASAPVRREADYYEQCMAGR